MSNILNTTAPADAREHGQDSQARAAQLAHPPGPPQQAVRALRAPEARTALHDSVGWRRRLTLWVGLELLLWSTRPERPRRPRRWAAPSDHDSLSERTMREHLLDVERARARSALTAHTGQYGR
ncbi:hypothetical protein [Microbacterium marinilacus]|uniref:Uncharacterized protein n=1 Tax=Microbacterium marinilacus TaxID=415209 RepID=A0ABP7B486_9MICO|nr:hypothetical protein [Microbacterium marinilacus]MBY0687922.1 hypothetical protein [Microbacterium marinilacus]